MGRARDDDWLSDGYESNWVRDKGCLTGLADHLVGPRLTRRSAVAVALAQGVVCLSLGAAARAGDERTAAVGLTLMSGWCFVVAWVVHRFAST